MIEIEDDVWRVFFHYDAVCIPTNGFCRRDGDAVMGAGLAAQARHRYPGLANRLGYLLRENGNIVQVMIAEPIPLVAFPVKPAFQIFPCEVVKHKEGVFHHGDRVPGWACVADLDLIENSARQLLGLVDERAWRRILLPRPGCGAGQLEWANVRARLKLLLDDRFFVIDRPLMETRNGRARDRTDQR